MFVGKPKDRRKLRAWHNNSRRKSYEGKAEALIGLCMGKTRCAQNTRQRRYFEYLREQRGIGNQKHRHESVDSSSSSSPYIRVKGSACFYSSHG